MRWRTLTGTAVAVAATAVAGAVATDPSSIWYRTRRKPDWQPPSQVFPLVWTPLYADLAVTSAIAIDALDDAGRPREQRRYRQALAVNLVLNAGWSWLFWRGRRPWLAVAECALLTVSSADLVARTSRAGGRAGLALVPYALWCGFATVLTTAIARRND